MEGIIQGGGGGSVLEPAGSASKPIYINSDGDAAVITSLDSSIPAAVANSIHTTSAVGSATQPVYLKSDGTFAVCTAYSEISVKSATTATTATTATNATNATNSANVTTNSTTSKLYVAGFSASSTTAANRKVYHNATVYTSGNVLYNAAWNDYAENRESTSIIGAGSCVVETHNGLLEKSAKRLQPAAYIVSDTFGMLIGAESNKYNSVPVAVSGRVLAITDKPASEFHVGDPVCSGKLGTISKMSRVECILFPDRIIGVVSEIPAYDTWQDIKVNNRIWVKIR